MPRWKGQKSIQNDTEQNEQTNRLFILGCKLQGRVKWPRPMQQSDIPNLRTPTLIPPIHLPLRGPRVEPKDPKDCRCEKICHWKNFHGHMTHNWHFLQWRSSASWLSQLTQLTLQGLQCIFLAYEGHHRLLRSAFPDRETGQGSTGSAETKGSSMIFYDLLVKYLVLMQTWCEVDTSIAEAVNKHQISSDQNPDDRHASTKICLTP